MGDFYDPEHPTPEEEENEAKIENVQKTGFIKGPMFKGVASSRFLPKGTKTKVNLEEQGRQKVSFSFSLTKKTLQNRFLTALGNDKQSDTPNSSAAPLQVDLTPKIKMDIGDTLSTAEESSPLKSRVELGKIHFKKHLLHVTSRPLLATTTAVTSPPPIVPLPAVIAESTTVDSPPSSPPPPPPPPPQVTTPSPTPISEPLALPHTPITVLMTAPVDVTVRALKEPPVTIESESSEVDTKHDTVSNSSEEHITQNLNEQASIPSQKEDSHIGKEEEIPDSSKSSLGSKKTGSKKKSSQSESTFLGSESDEDSIRTSSSQRSHDLRFSASVEKERDSKKNLAPLKSEDLGKSSRSKTERDDKYFSYSKLERDTRYISSRCRSERERRRSRSRSRSDRGSRTSLSYSRSERSHYYDSDRRYHRSSPYRERARYSRPYTDNRARESSDSEDEYKKTYSRRTSSHSSSYRDLRTSSYSKSDRDCKTESSYLDMEKRGKYSSKLERESRRTSENEVMKRCCSPPNELGFRRGSSYSKHENSASRYKSAPSKSISKSDKFKNSFCCAELTEEIKQSHSFSLQTHCSKGSEVRMISTIPEREKTGSPSLSNQLNDSPTFKKLEESPIFKSEFIGHDSHDSIKELDSLSKVKNDQLRSYCPIELNINGSPGAETDLVTFCTSKTDTVLMSSDDSVTGSEVSSLVKACVLSSNGFQNIDRCKEKDLDDTCMQCSKSESPFRETEPPVSPHQDKFMSSPVMTIDYSKIVVKEPVDMRVSSCKTKDSDVYCTSHDNNPSLCHSAAEDIEPSVMKISSNSFMNVHLKSKTVICDNRNLTDQRSKFACEEYKQGVGSTSSVSVNHFDDLYQPIESSGIASSLQSLPPGIKGDNLSLLQCGENPSPVLDVVLKSKSTEFLKHAEKEMIEDFRDPQRWKECAKQGKMPCYFDLIEENVYLTERKKNKSHRDIKRMQCECAPLSKDERAQGEIACGEDCLNRLLMIECSSRCPNGDYCSNRRFQRKQHADVEVILTEKKGWGLRAAKDLPSNTFVLEYCGEVLDHKEFKARVKEYARNKNIHYYFMALKNDEIIDATQKGNCSRFMNHSCEPNCETQKWTVNGQLRVGFFTTKLVPSGSELTFDYQFQRYGKEAQKCFCGSSNCRGYLGGENRVSIRAAGGKMKKERSRKKDSVDGELEALMENGEGLSDKNQVLSLSRLMVRIETLEQKLTCLKLIQNTHSQSCLKSFLERHGLSLLWIWMAELGEGRESNQKLQEEIIKTLEHLPIPTKNMLEESKVLPIIQRWSQTKTAVPQLSEGDGYSSENTSRAHTPLNTPDPSTKLSTEADTDTPKKLMFRRLKIISENSMDSAISDATSELEGKDGKEDLDQLENIPIEEEEELQSQQLLTQQLPESKVDSEISVEASKLPISELEADIEIEPKESNGTKLEEHIAEETPSQDEEEGVSDVESERSQEQPDKTVDISDLATKLLDSWKDLKEVYRIPKKSQTEKENTITERGRDAVGFRDQTAAPKTPNRSRERDPDKQAQNKEKRKRRGSLSPPSSAYERGTKRPDDRYDTPTSKKKVRKDRNKLSTEERRKLFEQEVAQREAQKQQQQMQNLGMTSPLPYDSLGYNASHHPFAGYPPGYPMQAYVDPSNPNAGKVLLPTPSMDPVCSPAPYDHSQPLVGHSTEPLAAPPPVPVVPHVTAPVEVSSSQYVAQSDGVVHQDSSVTVLPVPAPGPVQGQNYGVWDSNQQSVSVQQQYSSPAQSQPTIYYQGQTCPTVYGVTSPYSQTTPPIVQSYAQPSLQYIQGQQIFTAHPQGVVVQPTAAVTTIVAPGQPQPLQPPEMVVTNNLLDLPPPSPPKPKTIVLPPNWKTARDPEGKIYYYHVITRQTQWDPPTWESPGDDASLEHEAEMDLGTPTYDENPMKTSKKPKTAEADTSSELAKKSKEVFRKEMSQFIVQCLNPYRKPDCKVGRITTTEDFKHLARKLTHGVMNKELKYCKNPEDLECNENVKHKTKEYIKKYMQKFGAVYKPKEDTELE
uniref:Histone-lysine N-methyltransferase SETD2 n=1 Tax=Molossus molossus TaxID=27622 RepID=A0A7J8DDF1_MOLMO|nr:SET domain containing 2, histone lysine methyltransferase [Molossus molossus]